MVDVNVLPLVARFMMRAGTDDWHFCATGGKLTKSSGRVKQ